MLPSAFEQIPTNETVLQRLEWQSFLRAHGEYDSSMAIDGLLEGGGNAVAACVGFIKAVHEWDLAAGIRKLYTISGGAVVGSYLLANVAGAEAIITDKLIGRLFQWQRLVQPGRWREPHGRPLNLDAVRYELEEGEFAIDLAAVMANPTELYVGVTDEDGHFQFLNAKEGNFFEVILASASQPGLTEPVVINGKRYWDGGLANATPFTEILEQPDPPTDLFVVTNNSSEGRERSLTVSTIGRLTSGVAGRLLPRRQQLLLPPARRLVMAEESEYLQGKVENGDVEVEFIDTRRPVPGYTKHPQILREGVIYGRHETHMQLRKKLGHPLVASAIASDREPVAA